MPSTVSIIHRALGTSPIYSNPEHCALDETTAHILGCTIGDQIRVTPDLLDDTNNGAAMFTIRNYASTSGVYIGESGRARLGDPINLVGKEVKVSWPPVRTQPLPAGVLPWVLTGGELIEKSEGSGNVILAMAPHGGQIEIQTDVQAQRVMSQVASAGFPARMWACLGYRPNGGSHDAWHITSTDLSTSSFPFLSKIALQGVEHVVSFHGYNGPGIVIGGRASQAIKFALREAIAAVVPTIRYQIIVADPSSDVGGSSGRNIVNRIARLGDGIQIEQSMFARMSYGIPIADAVARVFVKWIVHSPVSIPGPSPFPVGRRVKLTYYLIAERPDGDPDEVPIIECGTGKVLTMASRVWLKQAKIEETARYRDEDGKIQTINTSVAGASGCWRRMGPDTPWGMGVTDPASSEGKSFALDPFRSIAVDPKEFKIGKRYFIPELKGLVLPDPRKGMVHDGWVQAVDVGPDIQGDHIDWFVGLASAWHTIAKLHGTMLDHVTMMDAEPK